MALSVGKSSLVPCQLRWFPESLRELLVVPSSLLEFMLQHEFVLLHAGWLMHIGSDNIFGHVLASKACHEQ